MKNSARRRELKKMTDAQKSTNNIADFVAILVFCCICTWAITMGVLNTRHNARIEEMTTTANQWMFVAAKAQLRANDAHDFILESGMVD